VFYWFFHAWLHKYFKKLKRRPRVGGETSNGMPPALAATELPAGIFFDEFRTSYPRRPMLDLVFHHTPRLARSVPCRQIHPSFKKSEERF
jgi:hypothetical protein